MSDLLTVSAKGMALFASQGFVEGPAIEGRKTVLVDGDIASLISDVFNSETFKNELGKGIAAVVKETDPQQFSIAPVEKADER